MDLQNTFYQEDYSRKIVPMTLEAAVVRLSDVIAYIGRDIEDSIKVGVVKRKDIPKEVTKVIGDYNSKIVDTLIKDIIIHSMDKPYLTFSRQVFEALMKLKDWNYKYIYASKEANKNQNIIETLFYDLYKCYLNKIQKLSKSGTLTESEKNLYEFIKEQANTEDLKRLVVDYIAGQTDQYFLNECKENIRNFNIDKLYN